MNRFPTLDEVMCMDAQAVFDHVVHHLLRQARRCQDDTGCLYRGPAGDACAVGAMMPDACYGAFLERRNLSGVIEVLVASPHSVHRRFALVIDRHYRMLLELQRMHDHSPEGKWPDTLHAIARTFGLSTSAIDDTPRTITSVAPSGACLAALSGSGGCTATDTYAMGDAKAERAFRALLRTLMIEPAAMPA